MNQPEIDRDDPRVLHIRTATRHKMLVRIDGVIWLNSESLRPNIVFIETGWRRVTEEVDIAVTGGMWNEKRDELMMPNRYYVEYSVILDRHELELAHAADPMNSTALSQGVL